MTWNSTAPDTTQSVSANGPILQANTTYTETSMQLDHYWNEGANEDGHHKWMQTVSTNDDDSSLPTNVARADDIDLVFFSRFKTATESTAQQDCQPYVKNLGTSAESTPFPLGVMQVLGIRAMAVWNVVAGGDPTNQNIVYSHNVASVARQITGRYQITYSNNLPSINYLVYTSGMSVSDNSTFNSLYGSVASGASVGARKGVGSCIVMMRNQSGTLTNAMQGWFIAFGG